MRIRIAAAAASLAFASTIAAAAPALADAGGQPNQHSIDAHLRHELQMAAKAGGGVVDTGTPGYGGLLGAPEGSYTLTSSTYSMGKFGDSPAVLATCATGYYVNYRGIPLNYIGLDITINTSSSLVDSAAGYPTGWNQVGNETAIPAVNSEIYQGFWMKLSNNNPFSSNSGSFTWTCVPLSDA